MTVDEVGPISRLDMACGGGKTRGLIDEGRLPKQRVRLAAFDGENVDPANLASCPRIASRRRAPPSSLGSRGNHRFPGIVNMSLSIVAEALSTATCGTPDENVKKAGINNINMLNNSAARPDILR